MPIRIQCPDCDKQLSVQEKYAGKRIRCPECEGPIQVGKRRQPRTRATETARELPQKSKRSKSRKSVRKTASWTNWWLVGGAGILLVGLMCAGLLTVIISQLGKTKVYPNQPEFGGPADLYPIADIPVPVFPDPTPVTTLPSGVRLLQVNLAARAENKNSAGMAMTMRIYMPPGQHADKSLPCVLVAPAGTNLMVGNALDAPDYHVETEPYALAGMVAVSYSLDGAVDFETATDSQFRQAYLKFRAACAGVVNGRNALEFALQKISEVDPQRIFCAGHSSAGTVSLLLAEHENRIRGCLAYCPAANVELRLKDLLKEPGVNVLLPQVAEFLKQSNPTTHLSKFQCPVFLFHARDDSNTPYADSEQFAERAKAAGINLTFSPTPSGGHYDSMAEEGIPRGIEWIQRQ